MNTPQSLFDVGFTAEELDLTANILSIGEYVDDRSEMVVQMVSSLRLPLLRSLLPLALRNTSVEDIKTVLFHELSCIPKRDVLEIQFRLETQEKLRKARDDFAIARRVVDRRQLLEDYEVDRQILSMGSAPSNFNADRFRRPHPE